MSSLRQTVEASHTSVTMAIKIRNENPKPQTYTTGDKITGEVEIQSNTDVRFDDVTVYFEGSTRTWMENFGASPAGGATSTSMHTVGSTSGVAPDSKVPFLTADQFLKLVQPVDDSQFPIPRMVSAGSTLRVPFTFVIPERLLPSACPIAVESPAVTEAHLKLPPSLGTNESDKDDVAPDMAHVSYFVRARLIRRLDTDSRATTIAGAIKKVRVIPAYEEQPPMHVEGNARDYAFHRERQLRKGLLGRKLGRLSMKAEQPRAMHIQPNRGCPGATTVPVTLNFAPANVDTPPPSLGTLTTKLKVTTYFSTNRLTYLPTRDRSASDVQVGCYSESLVLNSRCMANTKWQLDETSQPSKPVYKALLNVPVTEPKCKSLVPSFSNCFVTRTYRVDVSVSAVTSGHTSPSLTLKLPLQVATPLPEDSPLRTSDSGVDVEAYFEPRGVVLPPDVEGRGRRRSLSQLQTESPAPPPGYSAFSGAVPVRIPEPVGISPGCG